MNVFECECGDASFVEGTIMRLCNNHQSLSIMQEQSFDDSAGYISTIT